MEMRMRWRKLLLWTVAAVVLAGALLWALLFFVQSLQRTQLLHNQSTAIEALHRISDALRAYEERHNGYPDTLERLRGGEEGSPGAGPPERARLLETRLAKDRLEKNGYRFNYQPAQRKQRWAATVQLYGSYRLTAEPLSPGSSGKLFFYTDQDGTIRQREGEPAGPDDPPA